MTEPRWVRDLWEQSKVRPQVSRHTDEQLQALVATTLSVDDA
jgi:hypothetical protein